MERFIYRSEKHGNVEVRSTLAGADFRCPDDLERALARWADAGERCDHVDVCPKAFELLAGCVTSVAAEDVTVVVGDASKLEDLGSSVRYTCENGQTKVIIGKEPLARALTDAQVNAEAQKRNLWKPLHARMDSLSDAELHAEWMRRHPNQRLTAMGGFTDDQVCDEFVRRKLPASTVGREFYSGVVEAIEVAKWIPKVTDSDLISEMNKRGLGLAELSDETVYQAAAIRGLISGHLAVVDLVRASDDALRAECSRRDIGPAVALDSFKSALSEVDDVILKHAPDAAFHRADWLRARLTELAELRSKNLGELTAAKLRALPPFKGPACKGCGSVTGATQGWISRGGHCPGCCPSCKSIGSTTNHRDHDPEQSVSEIGLAVVDKGQWFMRCQTCGSIEAYGDQESAQSRADLHNANSHGRITIRTPKPIASTLKVLPIIDTPEKFVRLLKGSRPHEVGPGIAHMRSSRLRPVQLLDEASLADLVAADAEDGE